MEVGEKVRLVTFNGEVKCSDDCDPKENYWCLINSTGEVVSSINGRGRVMVTFDIDVSVHGLHCHNEIPNSLYILPSDLIRL